MPVTFPPEQGGGGVFVIVDVVVGVMVIVGVRVGVRVDVKLTLGVSVGDGEVNVGVETWAIRVLVIFSIGENNLGIPPRPTNNVTAIRLTKLISAITIKALGFHCVFAL